MATYYVSTATGDDADTGLTEGLAFLTIDHAFGVVNPGDIVWIKADGTYNEDITMARAGLITNGIVYEGYSSTIGDNGKVTIDGVTNCINSALANVYSTFKNLKLTNASTDGFIGLSTRGMMFVNCDFSNNGSQGIQTNGPNSFVNCIFNGNLNGNLFGSINTFAGCIFFANSGGTSPVDCAVGNQIVIYKCLFYNNQSGTDTVQAGDNLVVIDSTFDGDGGTGNHIYCSNETPSIIAGNILYDKTTGLYTNDTGAVVAYSAVYMNNLTNSLTNTYYNGTIEIDFNHITGRGDVTSAPAFEDEANDDYTLSSLSPAIGAGIQPGGTT